jgi:hypothetical protein
MREQTNAFHITEFEHFYRLHNVSHENDVVTVDWSKELLDHGKAHSQEAWTGFVRGGIYPGEKDGEWDRRWDIADAPLYHACVTALYMNRDHNNPVENKLVEMVAEMFRKDFEDSHMATMSSVIYQARGRDTASHFIQYARVWYENRVRIRGKDCFVETSCTDVMKALLETTDISEINEAYSWLTGADPYLQRREEKPKGNGYCAVALGGIDRINNQFYIATLDKNTNCRARGVDASVLARQNYTESTNR